MTTPIIPLKEFDAEMASTRKVIERVPSDKAEWKPHPKSFALGHLAQLVAWMPGWIARTLREPNINLKGGPGYSFEKTETLLGMFDKNVADARAALESVTGAALDEPWSLLMGDMVLTEDQVNPVMIQWKTSDLGMWWSAIRKESSVRALFSPRLPNLQNF